MINRRVGMFGLSRRESRSACIVDGPMGGVSKRELNFCVLRGAASGNFEPWIDMDGRYLVEGSDKVPICV